MASHFSEIFLISKFSLISKAFLESFCLSSSFKKSSFIAFDMAVDDYSHGNSVTTWVRVRSKKENHIRLSEYLTKGRLLLIEGTLSASQWKDKDENCQIQLSITADTLEFINTGKREEATSEAGSQTDTTSDVPVPSVAMPQENKEDLPF